MFLQENPDLTLFSEINKLNRPIDLNCQESRPDVFYFILMPRHAPIGCVTFGQAQPSPALLAVAVAFSLVNRHIISSAENRC